MKRPIIFMSFLLVLVGACGSSNIATRPIKPVSFEKRLLVAVGDIQNQTGDTNYDPLMDGITGNFIYELYDTQCFRLIERQRLRSMLDETKLSMSGLVDPTKTKEVGKLLGVDAILFVNLASVKYSSDKKTALIAESQSETIEVSLDARLVSVESGEILAASRTVSPYENDYSSAFGIFKKGEKADQTAVVRECIENSVKSLAREIAWQVSKDGSKK